MRPQPQGRERGEEDGAATRRPPLQRGLRGSGEFAFPTGERRLGGNENLGSPHRRKVVGKLGPRHLEQVLRPVEILERVTSEITKLDSLRKRVLDEFPRRARQQHLPAVGRRADPGCPMDADSDVAVLADLWLGRVDADAHPNVGALRPRAPRQPPLDVHRRDNRVAGPSEGREERIALRVHLLPVSRLEGVAQASVVLVQNRLVPVSQGLTSRVDPSMSVKRKVTVPDGSSLTSDPEGSTRRITSTVRYKSSMASPNE
jgi:hypothetical protein